MKREDMRFGMTVILRLPCKRRRDGTEEELIEATVIRPFTAGFMADCTDVRLRNGEDRMVHSARIELPGVSSETDEDAAPP